jgi:hypothetical protein
MKNTLIIALLLSVISCNNPQTDNNYYPPEVIEPKMRLKFDNAMYQMYKLNILQSAGNGLLYEGNSRKNAVNELLHSNLFGGKPHVKGDSTIFSFLMIDRDKQIISLHNFIHGIGYVGESIKFIDINDGVRMDITDKELSALDGRFVKLIQAANPDSLSNQLKFVLKQNKKQ